MNRFLLMQLGFWLALLLTAAANLLLAHPLTNLVSLTLALMSVLQRSSNIAAKYATFPPKLLLRYRQQEVPVAEVVGEFLLSDWATQSLETVERETEHALARNSFDLAVFRLSFLHSPNPKTRELFERVERELAKPEPSVSVVENGNAGRHYYCGKLVFYVIVKKYNEDHRGGLQLRWIIFLVSLVWGYLPTISKAILRLPLTNPQSVFDTVAFFTNQFSCLFLFYLTNLFYLQARVDINRTIFVMRQLTHLISTQKRSNEIFKLLPTLNFLEEFSLNSWKILRRVAIDYGKKYFYRHEIYLPVVFLLGSAAFFAIFGLESLAKMSPGLFGPDFHLRRCQIALGIICVTFLSMTFTLLWSFAQVNEFFEFHTLKLYTVRQTLSDIHKYSDFYFRDHLSPTHRQGYSLDINAIFSTMSGSHVHRRLAREIRLTLGDHLDEELKPFIQQSIQSIDNIIDEISVDQKYQSIEILGFVINKSFTVNLFVILVSVSVTFYELFIAGSGSSSF